MVHKKVTVTDLTAQWKLFVTLLLEKPTYCVEGRGGTPAHQVNGEAE